MQFTVDQAFNATAEVAAAADFPYIRLFTAAMIASNTPLVELAQVEEPWSVASPTAVGGGNWTYFSAMCWFYGRDIFEELNYPVGMIATDWVGYYDESESITIRSEVFSCFSSLPFGVCREALLLRHGLRLSRWPIAHTTIQHQMACHQTQTQPSGTQ